MKLNKYMINRTLAGVASIAVVLGVVSAGRWTATMLGLTQNDLPPAHIPVRAEDTPHLSSALAVLASDMEASAQGAALPAHITADTASPGTPNLAHPAENRFIVGVQDGFIAIFVDNGATISLKETTSIPINALPAEEQARLLAGIHADDAAALAQVLQDYGS